MTQTSATQAIAAVEQVARAWELLLLSGEELVGSLCRFDGQEGSKTNDAA